MIPRLVSDDRTGIEPSAIRVSKIAGFAESIMINANMMFIRRDVDEHFGITDPECLAGSSTHTHTHTHTNLCDQ